MIEKEKKRERVREGECDKERGNREGLREGEERERGRKGERENFVVGVFENQY